MRKMVLLPAALALGLGGCSGDSMTPGGRDVLLGGAGGALAGAAIGSFTANAGVGALIGAGVGVISKSTAGRNLNLFVIVVGIVRLMLGGGIV